MFIYFYLKKFLNNFCLVQLIFSLNWNLVYVSLCVCLALPLEKWNWRCHCLLSPEAYNTMECALIVSWIASPSLPVCHRHPRRFVFKYWSLRSSIRLPVIFCLFTWQQFWGDLMNIFNTFSKLTHHINQAINVKGTL